MQTAALELPGRRTAATCLATAIAALTCTPAPAAQPPLDPLEEVVVTAPYGATLARDRVPARVQTATLPEIERLQPLDLSDLLNRGFASVHINHAQNNPLQPDLNFRGFTASPLLGLPQGLAVFANGARMNDVFGDTVNWDLLALSTIHSVQLQAGSSPLYGQNSLGGAISVALKNGFSDAGTTGEAYAGSFARRAASLQHGANDGRWGYYVNVDYFAEDGWRDFSVSDALRLFGTVGLRSDSGSLDLSITHADSSLRGNGPAPAELIAIDRSAVFTHPDITGNRMTQLILQGDTALADGWRLAGNAYFRDFDTSTFNGDGTIFEECQFGADEWLVEEDYTDVDLDDECTAGVDTQIVRVLDPQGLPIPAELDGDELDAINNIGERQQRGGSASLQLSHAAELRDGRHNDLTLGASWSRGDARFDGIVEVAALQEDRSTSRTGILADEYRTEIETDVTNWSLYASDTLDLTARLALTLSGRFDSTEVTLRDRSGQNPELNGDHRFTRFNPAAGLAWRLRDSTWLYASLAQSSRAPTAVELACASEDAPCSLPNAFLADPPLDEVVARSAEAGLRSRTGAGLEWYATVFLTRNRDDILFQTTGGSQSNVGFFQNAGDTQRSGLELGLSGRSGRVDWSLDYTLLEATFRDAFIVNSPNHPLFDDDAEAGAPGAQQIVGDGKLLVPSGATIPGIPRHQANLRLDLGVTSQISLGAELAYRSGVYLRGDEINVLPRTSGYLLLNLRGEYRFSDALVMFARLENVTGTDYESFGLLGEPDEVFPEFEDPRFLGAGPPFGAWLGVRLTL